MKYGHVLRIIAMALCLALCGAAALAESAPAELAEFELPTLPAEQPEIRLDNPDAGSADAETGNKAAPPEPVVPRDMPFTETLEIDTATWEDVNLVREDGFGAAFAKVAGRLTLRNVLIEGKPARRANLSKVFALGPTGSIVVEDDARYTLDLSAFSFNRGDRMKLSAYRDGKRQPSSRAKWTSSKPEVAAVTSRGIVQALKKGRARITATFEDGSTAVCHVVATDIIEAESIALSQTRLTLSLNRSQTLKVKFTPSKTTFKDIKWRSSDPSIVSVDAAGAITGEGVGKATVTATTKNGKTAACEVTVVEIPLKRVDFSRLYITLHPGETVPGDAVTDPADTSYPRMAYRSSDKSVARVDKETGEITAVGCGTATITVRSNVDHAIRNTCKVCVVEPDAPRMEGLIIGINPGHQIKTITRLYPIAPGSGERGKGVKTGACGRWTRVPEYETNLCIGLKLRKLCQDAGAKVVITRTKNDVMLTNIERAQMLNEAGVDVALQLHCNSVHNARANGNSGYIRTTGDWVEESRALSKAITAAISKECGCVNLGVLVYNGYMSLNWTTTPSVLLEMGYLSNYEEDKLLATDEYRQKMAQGIFNGLCEYFGR